MLSLPLAALGALKRVPWQVWVILAVAALWWFERDAHGDARYAAGIADMEAASNEARKLAEAARASEEEALRELAKDTDHDVTTRSDQERGRTEQFIASGGVRDNHVCPGRPAAAPEDNSAGDGAPLREAPLVDDAEPVPTVAVLPDDVRICTNNTVKAEAWREYILSLEAR